MRTLLALLIVSTVSFVWCTQGIAQTGQFSSQVEALKLIQNTAQSICDSVKQSGSSSKEEISGKIGAQLPEITKKFLDVGVQGAGNLQNSQYQGVAQDQLADVIKHGADCRRAVLEKLLFLLNPPPPKEEKSFVHGPISIELENCEPALGAVQCVLVISVERAGTLFLIGDEPNDGLQSQLIPDNSHIPYAAFISLDVANQRSLAMSEMQPGILRKAFVTVQGIPTDASAGTLTVAFTFDRQPERATFHIGLNGR